MHYTSVSILTPSYNQGRFIGDCIASVARQTYPASEHIVMDGGSTDHSLDVLRAHPHLIWQSEKDRGQSHALNKAFARSSGEIIGWLNSDDAYADRRSIEAAVRIFETNPDVGLVFGHSIMVDAANKVLQVVWAPGNAQRMLGLMTTYTQPSVFMRRNLLSEPFVREDLQFVMDRDLWVRLNNRTRFAHSGIISGIDRHHGARKVESDGYLKERTAYYGSGRTRIRIALAKGFKLYSRARGLLMVPSLRRTLDPAIDLRFDSTLSLASRQGLIPRRFMA